MALRRRFLPVFKKHAPRGKPRFAKPLQGHFGPAAKHSQKHKNRPKIGRFSHFNPSAEMHPFSLFSASKAPQKWLCDAICRKKQLFAGSFGSRSHSFCSFTVRGSGSPVYWPSSCAVEVLPLAAADEDALEDALPPQAVRHVSASAIVSPSANKRFFSSIFCILLHFFGLFHGRHCRG